MKNNILSGLCWLILVTMLIASLAACGLFQKSRQKDYSRDRSETIDKTVIVIDRKDSSGMREQTVLELDIRIPKKRKGETETVTADSAINTITEAIVAAIQDATRLKAKVSNLREESRQGAENRAENRDYSSKSDSVEKSNDLLKDSNTSMAANVPWYAWLLGIGGVIALVYLVLKRYGML